MCRRSAALGGPGRPCDHSVVTPLLVVWVLYLVIKVVLTDGGELGGPPPPDTVGAHGFWALVGIVIGFCMWGNEPDIFRYGKPRFWW